VEIAIMASLFAKGNVDVDTGHNNVSINQYENVAMI
jgi:hypothetical protein